MVTLPFSTDEKAMLEASMAVVLLNLILEHDTPGYAYVALPADKMQLFLAEHAGSDATWPEYVRVLYEGEGEHPPEEIRAWFYDTYGFES